MDTHTYIHTHRTTTVTLAAHAARRGLIIAYIAKKNIIILPASLKVTTTLFSIYPFSLSVIKKNAIQHCINLGVNIHTSFNKAFVLFYDIY